MAEERSAGEVPTEIGGFGVRKFIIILYGGAKGHTATVFVLQQHNF
jgi:hypothetical protein